MFRPSASRLSLILFTAASITSAVPASAASQVRIVRLSDVQGSVQIDKNTGLGFENAFLNLPSRRELSFVPATAAEPRLNSRTAAQCALLRIPR